MNAFDVESGTLKQMLNGLIYVGYCDGPAGVYFIFSDSTSDDFTEVLVCGKMFIRKSEIKYLVVGGSNYIRRDLLNLIQPGSKLIKIEVISDSIAEFAWICCDFDDGTQIVLGRATAKQEEKTADSIFINKTPRSVWQDRLKYE
jgi:hypothetical protein